MEAKDIKRIYSYIAEINDYIAKQQYEEALVPYAKLSELVKGKELPEKLQNSIDKVSKELILYLEIKKVHNLLKSKLYSLVPDTLNFIEQIISTLETEKADKQLIKFAKSKFQYYKNLYEKEKEHLEFEKHFKKIKKLLEQGEKEKALALVETLKHKIKSAPKYKKLIELQASIGYEDKAIPRGVVAELKKEELSLENIENLIESGNLEKAKRILEKVE